MTYLSLRKLALFCVCLTLLAVVGCKGPTDTPISKKAAETNSSFAFSAKKIKTYSARVLVALKRKEIDSLEEPLRSVGYLLNGIPKIARDSKISGPDLTKIEDVTYGLLESFKIVDNLIHEQKIDLSSIDVKQLETQINHTVEVLQIYIPRLAYTDAVLQFEAHTTIISPAFQEYTETASLINLESDSVHHALHAIGKVILSFPKIAKEQNFSAEAIKEISETSEALIPPFFYIDGLLHNEKRPPVSFKEFQELTALAIKVLKKQSPPNKIVTPANKTLTPDPKKSPEKNAPKNQAVAPPEPKQSPL